MAIDQFFLPAVASSAFGQGLGVSFIGGAPEVFFPCPCDNARFLWRSVFLFISVAKQDYPAIRVRAWDLGRPGSGSLLRHILPVRPWPGPTRALFSTELGPEDADGCLAFLLNLRFNHRALVPAPPWCICPFWGCLNTFVTALASVLQSSSKSPPRAHVEHMLKHSDAVYYFILQHFGSQMDLKT